MEPTSSTKTPSPGASPKAPSTLRKLLGLFTSKERTEAALLLAGSLITALIQSAGVAVIFPFINMTMNPSVIHQNRWLHGLYTWGGFTDDRSFMAFGGMVVFASVILSCLAPAAVTWSKARFLRNKYHDLSTGLLEVYLSRPYQYFLGKNTSELGKNVLAEVREFVMIMVRAIFDLFIQSGLLIVLLATLVIVDYKVTLGAMVLLGGSYVLLSGAIKRQLRKRGALLLQANTKRYQYANEALSGIKTTRVLGIENYFVNQYSRHSLEYAAHTRFALLAGELPRYFLEAIAFGAIVLFLVTRLAGGGDITALLPLVSLYAFAIYRMMPALHGVYNALNQLRYHSAILDKIHGDMAGGLSDREPPSPPVPFNRGLALENIHFAYGPPSEEVIGGLSLDIPKNASVGLVGTTGSGKTTLVDILLGLLVPQRGRMTVDDLPITTENIRGWRSKIGYVPQEIYLSDDTVRNNIAFGIPSDQIDDGQVKHAAAMAALDGFVQTLPQGYDTVIGERGVRLSGGQRQRIGLARALYRDPEVLVLDEATSSLDGATEEAVLKAVKNASQARTVVMIAHRLNTLKDCDTIYIMEGGRFTAQGTYDELLEGNKTFMKMAKV